MRVVPEGFSTSTCVVTSKLRQSPGAAALRASGRHFPFPKGKARAAENAPVEERKSRRFMVVSWDRPPERQRRRDSRRGETKRPQMRPLGLPLLGSNQDSPDPESGVLPITPRGKDRIAVWAVW